MLRLLMLRLLRLLRLRLLMLRTVMYLLIARREGLRIARQVRLLLGLRLRRVARLVLAHKRLAVIVVAVKTFVGTLLSSCALLLLRLLLIVIGVLLAELFLRSGDQAEIMLGMLIVILSGHRIAGALRVARKLDVFFCDVRGGATNFYVGTVRFINARQRILAFAVVVVATSPHALLTISHDVPVRRPFTLSRPSPPMLRPIASPYNCKSIQVPLRGRTCTSCPREC